MRVIEKHTHTRLMFYCLFVDLPLSFTLTHVYMDIQTQCTRQPREQIGEKHFETTRSSVLYSSNASTSVFSRMVTMTGTRLRDQYHRHQRPRLSVRARFSFAVRERGIALLHIVVVPAAIEHFTCSCLCVVCSGQILFPVNCGGRRRRCRRRRFFPSSFHAHSHSHMPLIFFPHFIATQKKNERIFFFVSFVVDIDVVFIRTYLF